MFTICVCCSGVLQWCAAVVVCCSGVLQWCVVACVVACAAVVCCSGVLSRMTQPCILTYSYLSHVSSRALQLMMDYTFSRNASISKIRAGKYSNIRLFYGPMNFDYATNRTDIWVIHADQVCGGSVWCVV